MNNWKKVVVSPRTTIRDTVRIIDIGTLQIALVTDDEHRLIGTVTDGDIRRGILGGFVLEDPISSIMNATPVQVDETEDKDKILLLMRKKSIQQIPLVNKANQLVGLTTLSELLDQPTHRDNLVVLMAGGLGSRLGKLTENCPKPLLKVGGSPILETILQTLIEKNFHRFYISVNYRADMITDYFGDGSQWGCSIKYLHEDQKLGTAGPLNLLPEHPSKPIIVMNGDIMTRINFASLLDFHERNQALATMCIREFNHTIPYGVVKTAGNYVTSITEKPVNKVFVSAGIYVLNPEVLSLIPANGYYDMPTLFQTIIDQKQVIAGFPIHEYWLDIGRAEDFDKATSEFSQIFHA